MARILVVEDDKQFNRLLVAYLQEQGHEVASACNGKEGLRLFEDRFPDVVLTDIRMPKQDGLDLLFKFRNHPDFIPKGIILMSGFNNTRNDNYVESLKALGATEFLQKPFALSDLNALIGKIAKQENCAQNS